MRRLFWLCLLVSGCAAELSPEGARVQVAASKGPECRLLGTLSESEGGGLRSLDANIASAQAELRNRAAALGGDAVVVYAQLSGDTEEGAYHMTPRLGGLATIAAGCTNCVTLSARIYACSGQAPAVAPPAAVTPPACVEPEAPAAAPTLD